MANKSKFTTPTGSIHSVDLLQRADGESWQAILEPTLLDSNNLDPTSLKNLSVLDDLVRMLLADISDHLLPQLLMHPGPTPGRQISPLIYASCLVAHRAERLIQAAELTAGSLTNLERGAIQLSAVASRALLELAVVCEDISDEVLALWAPLFGSVSRIRADVKSADSPLFKLVWETRLGSRLYDSQEGFPEAKNIMGRIRRLTRRVPELDNIYAALCDATHPNAEAHATLWRVGSDADIDGIRVIRFAPGNSNTPRKIDIVNALILSLGMILPMARDLWWIAAVVANVCDMTVSTRTKQFGIPARAGRKEACSCGSGLMTFQCQHPQPKLVDNP